MFLAVFLPLLLSLLRLVAAAEDDYIPINIAPASNTAINDSWARFVYWQHPNGKIMLQQRLDTNGPKPQEINTAIAAKPQSPSPPSTPQAAQTAPTTYLPPTHALTHTDILPKQLRVSYLDSTNHIIDTTCSYKASEYINWSTDPTDLTSASGLALALANVGGVRRRFYVNDDDYLVQDVRGSQTPLGPKVAKGSRIAATVPVGETDLTASPSALPLLRNFAPADNPGIGFAAAAWSDPLIVRLFHINQDATASEWTYANGSWIGTEKDEFRIQGAVAGEPVATSQSSDGSGRYVEYMYATTAGNEINSVGRNSAQAGFIQGKLTSFEVDKPEDPKPVLSNEAIIAL
ncbi:hypothetical protein ACLOAV_005300 [Pseudogymnoascus australis]